MSDEILKRDIDICMGRLIDLGERLSELEASSASHTENFKDLERYLNISTQKSDIQKEIAELRDWFKEHTQANVRDINELKEELKTSTDTTRNLQKNYRGVVNIFWKNQDNLTEVLRELIKMTIPYFDGKEALVMDGWLAKLDVGSARLTEAKDGGIPTKNDQKSLVSPYYACGEPKNHKTEPEIEGFFVGDKPMTDDPEDSGGEIKKGDTVICDRDTGEILESKPPEPKCEFCEHLNESCYECKDMDLFERVRDATRNEPREDFEWIEHHKGKGNFTYGIDTHIIVKREDLQWLFECTNVDIWSEDDRKRVDRIREEYNL